MLGRTAAVSLAVGLIVSTVIAAPASASSAITVKRIALAGSSTGCVRKSIAFRATFHDFIADRSDPQWIAYSLYLDGGKVGRSRVLVRRLSDPIEFSIDFRLDLARVRKGAHRIFVGGVNFVEGDLIRYGSFTAVRC